MSPIDEISQNYLRGDYTNWLHAVCVVTFDLEIGQAIELIYPSDAHLNEKERANICYLSFPDSNSGLMGNVQFHFRIRSTFYPRIEDTGEIPQCRGKRIYDEGCPEALKSESGYLYGYVYFRQVKDKTLKRGYFQKSVVVLSPLPLVSLLYHITGLVAPQFFENGVQSLEAALAHIIQWPSPKHGAFLTLPFFGTLVKIRLASQDDVWGGQNTLKNALDTNNMGMTTHIIPNPHEIPAFPVLYSVLPYIHLIWELVLLAEPLVVMATNPATAASMVQILVSLISPLAYKCDYRPFFTIHDSEFREYASSITDTSNSKPPRVILGVTNPFFAKTLQHWPHVIRLAENNEVINDGITSSLSSSMGNISSTFNQNDLDKNGDISKSKQGIPKAKLSKSRILKVVEHKPGVYTRFKAHLNPDKVLIKRLLKGVQHGRPLEVQNAILRKHFLELTHAFLMPLESYATSLMPLQRDVSPYKSTPCLRSFNPDEFLNKFISSGHLPTGVKGDWTSLYKLFFSSPNFTHWFKNRQNEMMLKLIILHAESMSKVNLKEWVNNKCEVQLVDMLLRLRDKDKYLVKLKNNDNNVIDIVDKLHRQIDIILQALPEDLRNVMQS